jgi:class 3 adenylate cyclase
MSIQDWLQAKTDHLTLAIVFTDIVGSTVLQREVGDQQFHEIRRAHFLSARSWISLWNGYEVKTAGDSFFAVFKTAVAAFNFAVSLHDDTGDQRVAIRAGVHVGAVRIEDNGDIFGTAVNFTQRVMSVARGSGVMVSRDAISQIDFEKAPEHKTLRFISSEFELQGFDGKHQITKTATPRMIAERQRGANNPTSARGIISSQGSGLSGGQKPPSVQPRSIPSPRPQPADPNKSQTTSRPPLRIPVGPRPKKND